MIQTTNNLLICLLDSQRCALRVAAVERVLRAVAVTPLRKASEMVLGMVRLHGRDVPVVDLRRRLGLPKREIELHDRFVVVRTTRSSIIVIVDTVIGVVEYEPGDVAPVGTILSKAASVEGVTCFTDGLIYIHDLGSFLPLEEERALAPPGV